MGKLHFRKHGQALVPADDEAAQWLLKKKDNVVIRGEFAEFRNYRYLQKFMVMVQLGFDAWEPEQVINGKPVEKNFDRFRKDCTIAAGFYDLVVNIKGNAKAEAHSISFGKMGEEEFDKVYSAVLNVLLKEILSNYTREDADRVVDELMGFA